MHDFSLDSLHAIGRPGKKSDLENVSVTLNQRLAKVIGRVLLMRNSYYLITETLFPSLQNWTG